MIFKHYLLSPRAGALIRRIAWICIFGIGLGVMALVIVLSVMNGFNQSMERRLLSAEPHLVIHTDRGRGAEESEEELLGRVKKIIGDTAEISEIGWVEHQDVILRTLDGTFDGAIARGMESHQIPKLLKRVAKPRAPHLYPVEEESLQLNEGDVIIGVDLATTLGLFEGDQLVVIPPESLLMAGEAPPFAKVRVHSLLSTQLPEWDARLVIFERGQSLDIFKESPSRETFIEARLVRPNNFEEPLLALRNAGFKADSWADRNSTLFFALRVEKIMISSFLSLSILITSFSIITVLILLLSQKSKDIGILMAMGLSRSRTKWIFARLGMILAGLGSLWGLVLGVLVSYLLEKYPLEVLPDIYYDTSLPVVVSQNTVLLVTGLCLFIAFFGTWIPAQASVKKSPSDSLRGI